jgi:hypothetical protein
MKDGVQDMTYPTQTKATVSDDRLATPVGRANAVLIGCVSFELKVNLISGRVCSPKLLKEKSYDFQLGKHYTGNSHKFRDAT